MKGKPKKETFNLKKHILSFSLMNGTSSSKITIAEQMIPRLLIAFPISRYYVILCQKKDLFRQLSSRQSLCGALPQYQFKVLIQYQYKALLQYRYEAQTQYQYKVLTQYQHTALL